MKNDHIFTPLVSTCICLLFQQTTEKEGQTESILLPSPNYVGLENIANNCWFNALVQALAHTSFGPWLTGKPLRKKA